MINYICQLWIQHPVFVPHCWTVYNTQSVSVMIGRAILAITCISAVISIRSVQWGITLTSLSLSLNIILFYFIVEALNYTNIMWRINWLFITIQTFFILIMHSISETTNLISNEPKTFLELEIYFYLRKTLSMVSWWLIDWDLIQTKRALGWQLIPLGHSYTK